MPSANAQQKAKVRGRRPGDAPTLTEERKAKVLGAIRDAQSYEVAAMRAGITSRTLFNWMEKGAKGTAPVYVQFVRDLARAEAEAEEKLLSSINGGTEKYWQAKAWILERRFGARWGRQDKAKVEHSGSVRIVFEEVSADGSGGKQTKPKDEPKEGTEGKGERRAGAGDIDLLEVPQRK